MFCFLIASSQLLDHEAEAEVTLRNTGNVGFHFCIVDPQGKDEADEEAGDPGKSQEGLAPQARPQEPSKRRVRKQIRPGQPRFIPNRVSRSGGTDGWTDGWPGRERPLFTAVCLVCFQGYVDVCAEQRLRVLYLPGLPEVFDKQVQLKVASLPAQSIRLTGEGVPPTVRLHLSHTLSTPEQTHTHTHTQ